MTSKSLEILQPARWAPKSDDNNISDRPWNNQTIMTKRDMAEIRTQAAKDTQH